MNKKNKLQTMILAAGIALLFTLTGCGSPIEYEGADAPDFAILEQKTANNTSWILSNPSANYSDSILRISGLGAIAPDVASYTGGIVVHEVTSAGNDTTVYKQEVQIPITFQFFAGGTAYFSTNMNTTDKYYEVYIDAAKLTRQGGIKLNDDGDSTPGEEEDGAYIYVNSRRPNPGISRWTQSSLTLNYSGGPNFSNGYITELGALRFNTFSNDTLASYKDQIQSKLKLYRVSTTGSKTELETPTLTWASDSGSFTINPRNNIAHAMDLAYVELVLTDCDQIKSAVAYGFKAMPYTYDNALKTKSLATIQPGNNYITSFTNVYPNPSISEDGTSTSIILTPNSGFAYTELLPEDVIVLRLPQSNRILTNRDQQPLQFQAFTPQIHTAHATNGSVIRQVLIVPKPEDAHFYYLVAIKYNTDIKSTSSDIAGYFGNFTPQQETYVNVYLQDIGSDYISVPIPSEYWLWPSVLLNNSGS